MKYISFIILNFLIFAVSVQAQDVRRCVSNSFGGASVLESGYRVSYTFGQPPFVGTAKTDNVILRQGFEQPPEDDCLALSFTMEEVSSSCGAVYSFEYTGEISENATFTWNFGENASPSTFSGASPGEVAFMQAGTYSIILNVINEDCESSVSNVLDINESGFGATSIITPEFCLDEILNGAIDIAPFGGSGSYTFSWSTGSTEEDITGLAPGTYTLTISDGILCNDIIDFVVPGPTEALTVTPEIIDVTCPDSLNGSIILNITGGNGGYEVLWEGGYTGNIVTGLTGGTYSVSVSDQEDCTKELEIEVNVTYDNCSTAIVGSLKIPNTFTPDGDEKNETWRIEGISIFNDSSGGNKLKIYNRWGELIYEDTKFNGEWAGVNTNGELLPTAAYFYVLQLNDSDETVYSGSITIVR